MVRGYYLVHQRIQVLNHFEDYEYKREYERMSTVMNQMEDELIRNMLVLRMNEKKRNHDEMALGWFQMVQID